MVLNIASVVLQLESCDCVTTATMKKETVFVCYVSNIVFTSMTIKVSLHYGKPKNYHQITIS